MKLTMKRDDIRLALIHALQQLDDSEEGILTDEESTCGVEVSVQNGLHRKRYWVRITDLEWTHLGRVDGLNIQDADVNAPCNGNFPHTGPFTKIVGSDQASKCGCGEVIGK